MAEVSMDVNNLSDDLVFEENEIDEYIEDDFTPYDVKDDYIVDDYEEDNSFPYNPYEYGDYGGEDFYLENEE